VHLLSIEWGLDCTSCSVGLDFSDFLHSESCVVWFYTCTARAIKSGAHAQLRATLDAREHASRIKTSVIITALKRAGLVLIWMRGRLFRDAILHLTEKVRIMIWNFQLCSAVSPFKLIQLFWCFFFTKNAILISAYSLHIYWTW